MESLALYTGAPTLHLEYKISCISIVESKKFICRVKQIYIRVTKPYSGPIISQSAKWMTGFRLYPTSDAEHY